MTKCNDSGELGSWNHKPKPSHHMQGRCGRDSHDPWWTTPHLPNQNTHTHTHSYGAVTMAMIWLKQYSTPRQTRSNWSQTQRPSEPEWQLTQIMMIMNAQLRLVGCHSDKWTKSRSALSNPIYESVINEQTDCTDQNRASTEQILVPLVFADL